MGANVGPSDGLDAIIHYICEIIQPGWGAVCNCLDDVAD
jgi:hypothetical protein